MSFLDDALAYGGSMDPGYKQSITDQEAQIGIHPNPPRGGKGRIVTNPLPKPPADQGQVGGSDYKFAAVTNPGGLIQDYTETTPDKFEALRTGDLLQASADPKQLSADEYDKLTKEASKGNKLAQQILVSGHYQAHDYPTLSQDLKKMEDPFVNALYGMAAAVPSAEAAMQSITQPYDFTNAEAQVQNILKETPAQQTANYASKLSSIVGTQDLSTSNAGIPAMLGVPSIATAMAGLGPAAKLSEKASPYASLLSALLSHQQYQDIYQGAFPSSTSNPAWLQELLAAITGTTSTGGIVSPQIAAQALGAVPSATPAPTGSGA